MPFKNSISKNNKIILRRKKVPNWYCCTFILTYYTFLGLYPKPKLSQGWDLDLECEFFWDAHTILPWNCARNPRRRVAGSPRGRASRAWGTGSPWRSRSSSPRIWRALNRKRGNFRENVVTRGLQRDGGVYSWLTNGAGYQPISNRSPNKLWIFNSIINLGLLQIRVI
jgi:hypothetical protein